jgi:hypothetical protein
MGLRDVAERIMEIDRIDFPIAMKIINHVVGSGLSVELDPDYFSPGSREAAILLAEQEVEQRLVFALAAAQALPPPLQALISAAMAPRHAYAEWLAVRLSSLDEDGQPTQGSSNEFGKIFTSLIVMLEQSMAHAFVHWHHGNKANADAAWATSGAAMMQATEFVRRLAAGRAVPIPKGPIAPQISMEPDRALELDRELAQACATCADATTRETQDELGELCRAIADHAALISAWRVGQEHPAHGKIPPAFKSFQKTLAKFVWS